MRVLIVHQPPDGGVGRHVVDLVTGLVSAGDTVVVAGPERIAGIPNEVVHEPLALVRSVAPRADARAVLALARILRRHRPDVVHAHSSKAGVVARATRSVVPRTPVVYSPHGFAFAGFFEREAERTAYRAAEALLGPLTSRLVCVCRAEATLAAKVAPTRRIRVVHNGIAPLPAHEPDPRLSELARRGPVVASLTLLRPGKGIETLIDAAPAVTAAHPGVSFAIWGAGPDEAALTARAAQRGVAERVHFLGPVAGPAAALSGATVFVLPSWAESFPYVVLEAMSAGLPIVATDVGGITEAIEPGRDGLVVPARDERALAEGISGLLADPGRARRLAAGGRERVTREFHVDTMVSGIRRVYGELL